MLTCAKSTSWLIKTSNSSRIEECAGRPHTDTGNQFNWTRVQLRDVGLRTNTKLDHRILNSAYHINHALNDLRPESQNHNKSMIPWSSNKDGFFIRLSHLFDTNTFLLGAPPPFCLWHEIMGKIEQLITRQIGLCKKYKSQVSWRYLQSVKVRWSQMSWEDFEMFPRILVLKSVSQCIDAHISRLRQHLRQNITCLHLAETEGEATWEIDSAQLNLKLGSKVESSVFSNQKFAKQAKTAQHDSKICKM